MRKTMIFVLALAMLPAAAEAQDRPARPRVRANQELRQNQARTQIEHRLRQAQGRINRMVERRPQVPRAGLAPRLRDRAAQPSVRLRRLEPGAAPRIEMRRNPLESRILRNPPRPPRPNLNTLRRRRWM
jgi:hypothetical protein